MEFFRQLIDGIVRAWGKLNASARVNIGLAAIAIIVAVALLAWWGGRPNYVVLYSNLTGEDVTAIASDLEDKRVPFEITSEGTAIRVPSSRVYELRWELRGEGLPRGEGVGFEIFDRTAIGQTQFVQRVNYERALNTALARTLSALESVRTARVRVTQPEERLFEEMQEEPTASIVLTLVRPLGNREVEGILHFVASAVVGLRPGNITVIDTRGNILAAPSDDADSAAVLTSKQFDAVREYEKYLEDKATRALQEVLKPRRYVVTVSATLDFDEVQTQKIDYDEGVLRSEDKIKDTILTTQGLPRGKIGVVAAMPAPGAPTPSAITDQKNEQTTTEFELPETFTTTTKAPGTVKKLVVAALIEGKYQTSEDGEKTYIALETTELDRYKELIVAAAGVDEERGDVISVNDTPFEAAAIMPELPAPPWFSELPLAQIMLGAVALVAFLVLRSVLSKTVIERAVVTEEAVAEAPVVTGEVRERERIKEEIMRLSREQPDAIANLLKSWLAE